MVTLLASGALGFDAWNPKAAGRDRVVWSAGHCSPLFHALLALIYQTLRRNGDSLAGDDARMAVYPEDLARFRKWGGPSGHVESHYALADTSTGSSGHGISAGLGFAALHRSSGLATRAFVIAGDAETEEGMTYEARNLASNLGMENLVVTLDYNGFGIDGPIFEVMPAPYVNHWFALGWNVIEADGHNPRELAYAYRLATDGFGAGRPTVVIAHTRKGTEYGRLEGTGDSHGTPLPHAEYVDAMRKLGFAIPGVKGEVANDIAVVVEALGESDIEYFTARLRAAAALVVPEADLRRLPVAPPNGRGKALINILPLEQGERITTIMPLPEDESSWANLDVMFATTGGNVRRNKLSDFVDVRRSGIIAMKLDDDEAIVDVQICTEHDDVLLTAAGGQCIRFPVTDVRVFTGRTSMGVRGIALQEGDKLISLTILRHMDADAEERAAYLRRANAVRRGGVEEEAGTDSEDASGAIELGEQRYVEMSASEQFVLTISENGYGKRSSSFEYRTTGRGGKGIVAMQVNGRNGKLVASFPVEDSDQIMLVTDKGQLIRCPVEGIRIAGRSTQGVIVFDTAEDEHVVSVEHIGEEENGNGGKKLHPPITGVKGRSRRALSQASFSASARRPSRPTISRARVSAISSPHPGGRWPSNSSACSNQRNASR